MRYQKFKLKSGPTVILAPRPDTKAITALVLVKVGSRYETPRINGISHFLEHLMFKGTKKRPTAQDISRQLDGVGADYNAFTGKDYTGYYIKAASEKTDLCLDILADIYYHSVFDQAEINRERNVILEEINMYEDNPLMDIGDQIEGLVFGLESHLGQPIAGTKTTMNNIQRRDIVDFYNSHYRTSNITIVFSGKMNAAKLKEMIRKSFAENRRPKKATKSFTHWTNHQKTARSKFKKRPTEQVHAALGFASYSYFDKRRYAQYVLSTILGGNMSSRLFVEVRERRGLAYFIRAGTDTFEDTGIFYIQAGLDQKRLEEAFQIIGQELKKLKKEAVDADEIQRAKDYLKGKLALAMEDSESIADWLGKQQMLTGRVEKLEQQYKKIDGVTPFNIKSLAKELFRAARLNLAMIAGSDQTKKIISILEKEISS